MRTTNLFKTGLMAFTLIAFTACGGNNDHGHGGHGDHNEHLHSDTTNHMHGGSTNHMHEEQAAVYQCPMKCEGDKTHTEEGRCPVCKMYLKEV